MSGNWTNNGTFTANTNTVNFNGSTPQTIGGTSVTTFNNLTIANAVSGVSLGQNANVNAVLTLTNDLTTGANILTMPNTGTSAGTADVIGNVRRTGFTGGGPALSFGNPFNSIGFIAQGTVPTDILVNLAKDAPAGFPGAAVQRTYTITPNGGAGFSATLRLHYLDAELNGNIEANLGLFRNTPPWVRLGRTGAVDIGNNWAELSGVTGFSAWTLSSVPDVTVAVSPASVLEDGPDNLVYTFTRENPTTTALTVNFTVGGTASSSTDYVLTGATTFDGTNGTLTIPIGSSTATLTVNPNTDSTVEADETVIISVAAGTGYDVGTPGSATGTIINDDTDVSVAVAPSSTLKMVPGTLSTRSRAPASPLVR